MIPYARYFNELDCPPEGIDTVSVWIHPNMINRITDFRERGNIHESINCRWSDEIIKKTGQFIRRNYFIDFQAEVLTPYEDILGQIINYLVGFVYSGTLISLNNMDMPSITRFFMLNFSRLFAINYIDFYFDLKDGDCILLGKPEPFSSSRYSLDYPSSLKVYSKTERQKYKNHFPHKCIELMEYTTRIEFRLANANCYYLDYRNLQGSYEIVFQRFLPQLARKWFKHRREIVKVPNLSELPYAYHLNKIDELISRDHLPQNYELQKTPLRPKPEKRYGKNEVDINWLSQFISQ